MPAAVILSGLGEAARKKQGGLDGTLIEMWRESELSAKVMLVEDFRQYSQLAREGGHLGQFGQISSPRPSCR